MKDHHLDTLPPSDLDTVHGGLKWEGLPESKNIEDRRSAAAKARDQRWFDQNMKR